MRSELTAAMLDLDQRRVRHRGIVTAGRDGVAPASVKPAAASQFASLELARRYIDAVRDEIGSLGVQEMIDVSTRLRQAFHEFPELELQRPRRELSQGLQSAAKNAPDRTVIPLLMEIVAFDRSCLPAITLLCTKIIELHGCRSVPPILRSLHPSRTLTSQSIAPLVSMLCRRDPGPETLQVVSEVLGLLTEEEDADELGNALVPLLSGEHPVSIDSGALAKAIRSARHSPSELTLGRDEPATREVLLAAVERLGPTPSPQRSRRHPDLGWPSGRVSFDEFLLQWPCEVELSVDQNDEMFITEAYRAILLRAPETVELNQYLGLLQDGVVARPWIIEDLMGSLELRSLERRLRVTWGAYVMNAPERSEAEATPAVTWPPRPAS